MSSRKRSRTMTAGKKFSLGKPQKKTFKSYTTAPNRAKAVAAMSYRTGGFAGMEYKFHDTYFSGNVLTNPSAAASLDTLPGLECDPATLNCLNSPIPGDGASNRNGRSIMAQNIEVQGIISVAPATYADDAFPEARYVLVALVLDTQTNGQQMNSEDLWVNPVGLLGGAAAADTQKSLAGSVVPLRNLADRTRFRVLAVKRVQLVPQLITSGKVIYNSAHFRFYRKLGFEQNFLTDSAAVTSVASISNNSLHVLAVCTSQEGGVNAQLTYNARFRFTG